jgi:hypothetical protein
MIQKSSIQLERIDVHDDDGLWHVMIRATNGDYSVGQELYAYPEDFGAFVRSLEQFGDALADEASFESGKLEPEWAHYLRLRAFIHGAAGAAAVEVVASNNSGKPFEANGSFCIRCEVADINAFGRALKYWVRNAEEPLVWVFGD